MWLAAGGAVTLLPFCTAVQARKSPARAGLLEGVRQAWVDSSLQERARPAIARMARSYEGAPTVPSAAPDGVDELSGCRGDAGRTG